MHIAILGNGISGTTAARFIRKLSDHKISMISAETDYPFSRTALMYIYMGHEDFKHTKLYEDQFYSKNDIDLVRGYVSKIDFDNKVMHFDSDFHVDTAHPAPNQLEYDVLILATGSNSNKFGWPGQELDGVHGLYSYQDLETMELESKDLKRAAIVGGGLIGVEMAEMFHSRGIPVSFLVREDSYWNMVLPPQESEMVNREIKRHGIDLRLNTELKEITSDENDHCKAVITDQDEEIECGYVGLTAGVHPNLSIFDDSPLETDKGILVDPFLKTNLEDVYAIGDCAELKNPPEGRKAIEAVWYVGKMMGETVAYTICGHPTEYQPGVWFNSAKFFDIEYEVYGNVPAQEDDPLISIYWENEEGNKSIRIVYDKNNKIVQGFNLMGIRFRHELCDAWISHQSTMPHVLKDLRSANFDPEMYRQMEPELIEKYNEKEGTNIKVQSKRTLKSFLTSMKKLATR
jgi:NAD(P)H-nitrite reductase large subunit